jgi:hypothetical protein
MLGVKTDVAQGINAKVNPASRFSTTKEFTVERSSLMTDTGNSITGPATRISQ